MKSILRVRDILSAPHRRQAWLILGLMFVGVLLEMMGVGLIVPAIAVMMQGDLLIRFPALTPLVDAFGLRQQHELVLAAVCVLAAVYLVKNLFLAFLVWTQAAFAYSVQADASRRLFAKYLAKPYIFHVQNNSAQLIRNVTTESSFFASHALMPGMLFIAETLVLIGLGCLLFWVEPGGAALVALVVGGASALFYGFTRTRATRWGEERQRHEGLRLQQLQQGLGGAKDVKLMGRENDFLARFDVHNRHNSHVAARQAGLQQMPRLWLETLAIVGMAVLVASTLRFDRELSDVLPTLGLFAGAAFRLIPSMNRILTSLQNLRYGLVVVNVLHRELSAPVVKAPDRIGINAKPFTSSCIDLNAVSYRYPGAQSDALRRLSLRIFKGETVGLIGTSGAGKSTLVDVILGLLQPTEGTVDVDGSDIGLNLRSWQNQIGYVPQSIYLIDDSLRRNVAFGIADADIDDNAVRRALSSAQLDDFVSKLPDGLETSVGERGVRLSGGQRQRIGIARALYHNPPILVLDEATSALDLATEREVMSAVNAMHGDKTIIIVAHRLSTVKHCDRIYTLEGGCVVSEGSPEQVLPEQGAPSGFTAGAINN